MGLAPKAKQSKGGKEKKIKNSHHTMNAINQVGKEKGQSRKRIAHTFSNAINNTEKLAHGATLQTSKKKEAQELGGGGEGSIGSVATLT